MLAIDEGLYFAFHGHRPGQTVECQICDLGIDEERVFGSDAGGRVA